MKLLLCTMLFLSQTILALGSIDLKNIEVDYKNGSGSASFDSLKLQMGDLEVDVNNLHKVDVDYRGNAYEFTERFDNKTSATFRWLMTDSTSFFRDLSDNVLFKTYGPVDFKLGTRQSDITMPHLSFANENIVYEAKGISVKCSHPSGFQNPNDYAVHALKACLVNSHIKLTSLVSRQEDVNKPLISEEFDAVLEEAKHPLAQKTGIDFDKHRTKLKDKHLVDQLDIKVDNGQVYLDMFVKFLTIPIRIEFFGPVRLLEKEKKLRIHVDTFKVLGANVNKIFMTMVTNFLKKYDTKIIKVKYPFILVDITGLYTVDY